MEAVRVQNQYKENSSATRATRLIVVTFRDAIEKAEDLINFY